jgi:hypothetical protein
MLTSPRISLTLCLACLGVCSFAASALAGSPAPVTVRVEGAAETVLPPTQVTTTTAPVEKEGHSCSGTSAAGALQLATSGNWGGSWFEGSGFFVETIEGHSYAGSPTAYWSFWVDNKPSEVGICEAQLEPEAGRVHSILFFPECFGECPAPPSPLGIEAPAVAEVGKPLTVTVSSYANPSGARSAASGADVAYEGTTATTDSSGHVTLTLTHAGEVTIKVSAPQSIRTEAGICVHAENDGGCGSTVTTSPTTTGLPSVGSGTPPPIPYKGSYALVPTLKGILLGHHYKRGSAPKVLAGTVNAHSAVTSVSLKLRREYRGRCWAYDGASERFPRARCGSGAFFQVSTGSTFSYLLPAALAPGRYVLDVQASDAAGNHTTLAWGTSRVVFYVR